MQEEEVSYKRQSSLSCYRSCFRALRPSLREVKELVLKLGVEASNETIRRWTVKFDPMIVHVLRRHCPSGQSQFENRGSVMLALAQRRQIRHCSCPWIHSMDLAPLRFAVHVRRAVSLDFNVCQLVDNLS